MAESRRYGFNTQLDIEQILLEAQNRWLRPAEICEILRNYRKFRIAPEPPNKPSSGSLFLFDRKVLRYFRKDGHNWRKKKDGKTVKEAHERLKAGSIDVLHCYYAHGEENESFQRRSYWMLEEDFTHIVLVHYREVKGNRTSFGRTRDMEEILPFHQNHNQLHSQTMDTSSLTSAQTSEYEDTESDNHQASSRYCSFPELQQSEGRAASTLDVGLLNNYSPVACSSNQCDDYQGIQSTVPGMVFASLNQGNMSRGIDGTEYAMSFHETKKQDDLTPWEDVFEHCTMGYPTAPFQPSVYSTQPNNMEGMPKAESVTLGQLFTDEISIKQEVAGSPQNQSEWQIASEDESSVNTTWPMDQKLHLGSSYDLSTRFQQPKGHYENLHNALEHLATDSDQQNSPMFQNELRMQLSSAEVGYLLNSNLDVENNLTTEGNVRRSSSFTKQLLLDCSRTEAEEGLKKFDSFSRWMSRELGEVESHMQSSSGVFWNSVESENVGEDSSMSHQAHLDAYLLSPSLSQDQLFSIVDFSPNWAYTGLETKVLVSGIFLKNKEDADKCKWSCMFGEVEVPAEVLADGVLRCVAPVHSAGRVPFYVTCSNRLACSEVREFEYRVFQTQFADTLDSYSGNTSDMLLHIRLGKLLSLESVGHPNTPNSAGEKAHISSKISLLLKESDDEWFQMTKLMTDKDSSPYKIKEKLLQKLLKEQLHAWLLHKVAEDGKGPNVLDNEGQGVLHLAAALGYDWAIAPTLAAGVNINFRDVHGWTALHWAAFSGRESTVVVLISLDAAPGALIDPTPTFPSGRTPADLASANGHKGIAGYLAEFSLTTHLSSLTLKEPSGGGDVGEGSSVKAVETIADRSATQPSDGDLQDGLSLKDSLTAVRNAVQAAARIHQVFRVDSFHRKQLSGVGDGNFGSSDERALSLISIKSNRPGQHGEPVHMAAIRIQNKFRGWKGRKEFLIIRQRIVKIQAHVRGHQVRKHYKNILWSVGIVEKVILRWRRRGTGLRGFRTEGLIEGPTATVQSGPSKEDDYDFLQEGRKQTEARLEKALARVKSMVQYPEARDQYRRLVTDFQKTKVVYERLLNESEEAAEGEDLIDIEALLEDDTFMPTA